MDPTTGGTPTPRVARLSDALCAAVLLVVALLKVPLVGRPAAPVSAILTGVVEIALAALLLSGTRPRFAAFALVLLGLGTTAWSTLKVFDVVGTGPCGCLGLHEPSDVLHALVASALLFLGGLQTHLLARRRPS